MFKKIISISLILLFLIIPAVSAAEDIDISADCNLNISSGEDAKLVEDMEFDLYRIASLDRETVYTMDEAYRDLDIHFTNENQESWQEYADILATYIQDNDINPTDTAVVDSTGTADFIMLETGIYLVAAEETTYEGYRYSIHPYLVSLPAAVNGEYVYDVKSKPKYGECYEIEKDDKLPQTGALWWPCPVMFIAGIFCIVLGFKIRRRSLNER